MVDQKQPDYDVSYFQRDKIVFQVTADTPLNEQLDVVHNLLRDWENRANKSKFVRGPKVVLSDPEVLDFPATPQVSLVEGQPYRRAIQAREPFSLIFAKVTDSAKFTGDGLLKPENLLNLVSDLNKKRQLARKKVEGVNVERIVLDWFCGPGSEPGSTGGPGGKPVPTPSPKIAKKDLYNIKTGQLSKPIRDLIDKEDALGKGVVVYILDTVPSQALDSIYKQWVTDRIKPEPEQSDPHTLIQNLLDGDIDITVHRDPELGLAPAKDWKLIDHDYKMSSHGLAVLGIIASRVPKAKIHWFEVLNQYGVGSLASFARALQQILQLPDGKHSVTNGSLVFTLPSEPAHTKIDSLNDLIGKAILSNLEEYKAHAKLIGELCDLLYGTGGCMIAAAGNDYDPAKHGDNRPGARYPAAHDSVLGVGASGRITKSPTETEPLKGASYSNLADKPSGTGVVTFGGEKDRGVLGIYIEDQFPPDDTGEVKPNLNGWCLWSGTSFAAPFVSGVTAAVLSSLIAKNQSDTTQDAISTLSESFHKKASEKDEDVLFITQR